MQNNGQVWHAPYEGADGPAARATAHVLVVVARSLGLVDVVLRDRLCTYVHAFVHVHADVYEHVYVPRMEVVAGKGR